jgi:hypothetical protein
VALLPPVECSNADFLTPHKLKTDIQGVSGEIVNVLEGGSMDYSYKQVSKFQWV